MIGIVMTTVLSFLLFLALSIIVYVKNRMRRKKIMKTALGVLVFGIIVMFFVVYAFMPTITVPNMLILNVIVAVLFVPLVYGGAKVPVQYQTMHRSLSGIVILGVAVAVIGVFIYSILALEDSYDSISKSEEEEARPLNEENTPISVAPESARNKVQKAMSVVPNTQFYDLGKLQAQRIDGEISYVAPVEFSSFWRYLRGKETEGYFTITATNINAQPEFVQSKMRYTNSSFFNHNVQRVVYGKHPDYIQSGEAQIEVDDEGKPWYVQTIYKPLLFSNRPDMKDIKVAIVDPVSGDVETFESSDAPDFVEGSVSSELAAIENEYFGKYVNGWLNSIFGKKDVKIPNESGTESSVTPIFNEAGEMFYFTDMASPKENIDSALGYTLINARTGELTYYNGQQNQGIMDSKGAVQIVNKQYPEKNWTGTMPVLYNVDGHPTWIVNVLDPNGLFKQYAYIKAADSDFAVFGDTAKQTLNAYRLQIAQDPSSVEGSQGVDLTEKSGTINRVLVTSTDSRQSVQFLLEGETTIYTVNTSKAPLAIFLKEGDQVNIQARIRDNGTATVEEMQIQGIN
ncbi:DNA-binding protein [Halobacillus sp. Nhm2S1]|uniref:DNA-binding protein n=1 Tax=Halobacillus sp. Nhm2S1 TaxID=2866716 RepID=UPI001C72CEBB|nr:DNA-binding protein [Halobacillus sp. Nhm2S1]MBX0359785.1 DNA-binding protein [Halobacillus sp. Nhm2S1]